MRGDADGEVEGVFAIEHHCALIVNLLVHAQQAGCKAQGWRGIERSGFEVVLDTDLVEAVGADAEAVSSCVVTDAAVLIDGVEFGGATDDGLRGCEGVVVDQVAEFAGEEEKGEDGARRRVHFRWRWRS